MEIRQSSEHLISTMGFPILVRLHFYIESAPLVMIIPFSLNGWVRVNELFVWTQCSLLSALSLFEIAVGMIYAAAANTGLWYTCLSMSYAMISKCSSNCFEQEYTWLCTNNEKTNYTRWQRRVTKACLLSGCYKVVNTCLFGQMYSQWLQAW